MREHRSHLQLRRRGRPRRSSSSQSIPFELRVGVREQVSVMRVKGRVGVRVGFRV